MEEELLCSGCGIKLQCEDETKDGYVDPRAFNREIILCKRCYQLKHYGKFVTGKAKNTISLLHNNASKDDLILLICDVALCYSPIVNVLSELNGYKNVVLVANRYDLYKDYISIPKAKDRIKKALFKEKLRVKDIFIVNNNIEEIFEYIDTHSINSNCYLVGLENAGKTTFINNILKEITHEESNLLTNSRYPGTTIDLIKIPLDEKHYLIDSPGVKSKGNLLNYVDINFIKDLKMDNKIIPLIYQLNPMQSLLISNVIKFDYLSGVKQSIVFYGSAMLEITRAKLEKSEVTFNNRLATLKVKANNVNRCKDLTKTVIEIKDNKKHDIVIEGIGFISVKKGVYAISTYKGVNVFVRDAFI